MPHTSKIISDDITKHIGIGKSASTYYMRHCNAVGDIVKCGVIQQREAGTKFLYRFHPEYEYNSSGTPVSTKRIAKIIIDDFRDGDKIDVTDFVFSLEILRQSLVNNFIKITLSSGTNLYINVEHGLKGLMHYEDFYIEDIDIR